MKALLSIAAGGPGSLRLTEVPDPVPRAGEVLIHVAAAAVNYPDVLIIEDRYQFKPDRPFAPGSELSGVIEAVGAGVTQLKPGTRVVGLVKSGALAEKAVAEASRVIPIPVEMDFATAAALFLTYGTAIHSLTDRGALQAGETLLVLGAAGGVGLAAVELGKAMGATVIAAVSSEEKAQAARDAGAARTVIYKRGPFDRHQSRALAEQFKQAVGPEGAHVILDPVGGDYAEPALRSIAWGGRYLVAGFTAGIPSMPMNLILLKACQMIGVFWGIDTQRRPEALPEQAAALFGYWRQGAIKPLISATFPLAQGGNAIEILASRGAVGKIVIEIAAAR